MRKKNFFFLLLCLMTGIHLLHAQNRTITGTVRDRSSSEPLPNVSVTVPDTKLGTVTDASGEFSIQVPAGTTQLVFTLVNFEPQSLPIEGTDFNNVVMDASFASLDQVVVVGYGTQKKQDLTGAVATVDVDKVLGSRPITDISRGLQGAVPGLTITTPSGDIGTNPSIRLRGVTGSLNAPDGAKPLILVDNVEFPDLRLINPDDIESISVLKDAASASIYGTRGAWGVILITTKSGKRGADRTRISYTNNFSYSKPTVIPEIADAAAGTEMAFRALQRTNPNTSVFGVVGMYFDEQAIQKMKDWQSQYGGQDLGPEMVLGRDFEFRDNRVFFYRPWEAGDLFLRKTSPQQTHNLSFSGSSKKTNYNVGLGYLGQSGVLKVNPDKFERYNVSVGLQSSLTSWLDARAKVILSKGNKTKPFYYSSDTYDPWYYLYRWPKTYPYGTYEGLPFRSALTEVQQANMTDYESNLTRISIGGTVKITKGLRLDADYTYEGNDNHEHQVGGSVSAYNFWAGGGNLNYGPYTSAAYDRVIYNSDWDRRNVVKAFATYDKMLGDHSFKAIGGTDIELFEYWSQSSQRRGLLDPNFGEPGLATGDQFVGGSRGHFATLGYFGRINYAFKDKYLVELNGRFDGSSSFPKNNRWGFFPSASVGYILSKESFMDFTQPVLSFLKLRASWGSIGNQALGRNRFLSTMSSTSSGWIVNGVNQLTLTTPGLVSPSLSWETVTTLDLGLDARFLNDALGVTFDWYRRTTSDMIGAGLTVPSTLGTSAPVINFGELQTTGFELAIDWQKTFNNGLHIAATAMLSDYKERITKYANSSKLLNSNFEGKTIGDIWGYETDRFFTKDDFEQDANGDLVLQNGKYVLNKGIASQDQWESGWFFYGPGDVKYVDANGDGRVDFGANSLDDHGDLKVIGNSTPRYQYGFRLNADWKGFDVALFIQGVGKRSLWANGPIMIPGYRPGEAWYQHQLDYWTEENPNAYYPRPTDASQSNNSRNFLPQTKYLLNMAYTRLKNVTIGYSLPLKWIQGIKMQSARIYLSGENLAEIDHLKIPVDPETDYTTAGLNDPNTFGRIYPYRRTYSFGLQVNF